MICRRVFVGGMAAVMAAPDVAIAQNVRKTYRIGYVTLYPVTVIPEYYAAFRDELRQLGYVEGQGLVLEQRTSGGDPQVLRQIGAAFELSRTDVIVTSNTFMAAKVLEGSKNIPIVVVTGGDYIGMGLAATLAKPGGIVTGLAILQAELAAKRLELVKEAVSGLRRIFLVKLNQGPKEFSRVLQEVRQAADDLGIAVTVAEVSDLAGLEKELSRLGKHGRRSSAMVLLAEPIWFPDRARIAELAVKQGLPAVYEIRAFAEAGFLMSYGPDVVYMYRRAAGYVDKILRGALVGDLPIEHPSKLELVINLKTARALNLTIPPSLLVRADQVIE